MNVFWRQRLEVVDTRMTIGKVDVMVAAKVVVATRDVEVVAAGAAVVAKVVVVVVAVAEAVVVVVAVAEDVVEVEAVDVVVVAEEETVTMITEITTIIRSFGRRVRNKDDIAISESNIATISSKGERKNLASIAVTDSTIL
jgi:hypothetical protein